MIIGVDEVGRGPIVGDLVVCAAGFSDAGATKKLIAAGCHLMDSKAFKSRKRREAAFDHIMSQDGIAWSIARRTPRQIDDEGIHHAVLGAMAEAALAVAQCCGHADPEFCFDGKFVPEIMKCRRSKAVVKGDSLIAEISMASIIAKVIRDREMCDLSLRHPYYGFDRNSGYGTAEHIAAIRQHGLIEEHRSWARKFSEHV